jgi:zinc D-Ala-D-Ala carboxypeptidase
MSYFKKEEFACKCGCGMDTVADDLVDRLNEAREIAGVPFRVNSGCRCKSHNRSVGGSKSSGHLAGEAVDIATSSSKKKYAVLKGLIQAGFERIGIGKNFIHVDVTASKTKPTIWTY